MIAHVGGYDFCDGLREARLHGSRRLDRRARCRALLNDGQQPDLVCYFTSGFATIPPPRSAGRRSSTRSPRGGIEIDFGHFISKERRCKDCGRTRWQSEEKKTDVNSAVPLLPGRIGGRCAGDLVDEFPEIAAGIRSRW